MEAKRELYLQYPNRVRDGSSSAQVKNFRKKNKFLCFIQSTSSSSPVSDRSLNLRGDSSDEYSSTKPLHHSSESDSDSPIDDSATNSTQENFADFRNFEKIVTSTERLEIKSAHSSPNQVENIEATKIDQPKSKSLPREALGIVLEILRNKIYFSTRKLKSENSPYFKSPYFWKNKLEIQI